MQDATNGTDDPEATIRAAAAGSGAAGSGGAGSDGAAPGSATGGAPGDGERPRTRDRASVIESGVTRVAWWSLKVLLIAMGLVLLGLLIGQLWSIVLPLALGIIIATVLYPPVRFLVRHRWPPALASLSAIVLALVVLGLIVWLIAPQVAGQSGAIVTGVSAGISQIQQWLAGPPFNLGQGQIGTFLDSLVKQLQASASTIAGGVFTGVSAFASSLLNIVIAVVLAFFFIKDGPRFLPWLNRVTGERAGRHVSAVLERSWRTLSGFIRVQAQVAFVDAVFIGIGLLVLGVPLALPLIVLTFFGGFIPIVGAFVAGALAVLVALVTKGFTTALIVLAIIIAVQQIEGNVLQPFLQSRSLKLHAAVVLLAVTAGGTLFGIAGAFLAVPVAGVAAEILRYMGEQIDERTTPADLPVEQPATGAEPSTAAVAGPGDPAPGGDER